MKRVGMFICLDVETECSELGYSSRSVGIYIASHQAFSYESLQFPPEFFLLSFIINIHNR